MPNTKSAEKRVRSSARKQALNHATISRVKTAEKKYLSIVSSGKTEDATKALAAAAVKRGSIKAQTASRKRSRLQLRLNKAAAAAKAK
jgi:small subunit ribosomal protein S20